MEHFYFVSALSLQASSDYLQQLSNNLRLLILLVARAIHSRRDLSQFASTMSARYTVCTYTLLKHPLP